MPLTETRYRSVTRVASTLIAILAMATPALAADSVEKPVGQTLQIYVCDENGSAVPHATIQVAQQSGATSFTANEAGRVTIPRPVFAPHQDFYQLSIFASGHAPSWSQWFYVGGQPRPTIPASIVMTMVRGSKIGGRIVNDAGDPIPGATVRLFFQTPKRPDFGLDPTGTIYHSLWDYPIHTDDHGRWQCDMAPEHWTDAFVQPTHPDYFGAEWLTPMKGEHALRAGESVATMARGRSIAGRVIGADGAAIAGATVITDSFTETTPQTISAADGTFIIPQAGVASIQLLVHAKGFGPTLKSLPSGNVKGLEVRLPKAAQLHGRVVDEKGNPLAETYVTLTGWTGSPRFTWQRSWDVFTDGSGRFVLEAPSGVTSNVRVVHDGFDSAEEIRIADDGTEQLIVLRAEKRVTGSVTDAKTGHPIEHFTVLSATRDPEQDPSWSNPIDGAGGHYSLKLSGNKTHRIRLEAEGYRPISSEVLEPANGSYTFNAEMVAEAGTTGTVVSAAEKPVSGVMVLVIGANDGPVTIDDSYQPVGHPARHALVSNEQGQFILPAQNEAFDLLALCGSGYAKISAETFAHSHTIHLQPWSGIEGSANVDGKNFAPAEISARVRFGDVSDHTRTFFSATTRPSAAHLAFDHVPEGDCDLTLRANYLHASGSVYETRRVVTENGHSSRVELEGGGRAVRVTGAMPKEVPEGWHFAWASLQRIDPSWSRGRSEGYDVSIDATGSALFPTVSAGNYQLKLLATKPSARPSGRLTQAPVATASQVIHVESTPTDAPLDLGTLSMTRIESAEVGDAAPDFQCTSLDGQAIKLSSLRGKFAVLDFWATWCGPCTAQTPALKSIYDSIAEDGRVVMLSLSLDDNPEAARTYVKAHDLKWLQGYVGGADTTAIDSYNVQSIPALWLIDPNGKIIANPVDAAQLKAAVNQALSR